MLPLLTAAPAAAQTPLCSSAASARPAKDDYGSGLQFALVLGNGAYLGPNAKPLPDLPKAAPDAEMLAGRLKALGYGVRCVLDARVEQAEAELAAAETKAEAVAIEIAQDVSGTKRNAVRFLVYYAGHGAYDKREDANVLFLSGRSSFAPDQCRHRKDGACFDPRLASMKLSAIVDRLTRFRGIEPAFLIDACRTDADLGADYVLGPNEREPGIVLANRAYFLAYSTQPGRIASDGRFMQMFSGNVAADAAGPSASFGKSFNMIFGTTTYFMQRMTGVPFPQVPQAFGNVFDLPVAEYSVWRVHGGDDEFCAHSALELWIGIRANQCAWDGTKCVHRPVHCAIWNEKQRDHHGKSCWTQRLRPIFSRYYADCDADITSDASRTLVSAIAPDAFRRLPAARGPVIVTASLENARQAYLGRAGPQEKSGAGKTAAPGDAINVMVRDLDAKTVNEFVRAVKVADLEALGRQQGDKALSLADLIDAETLNGLVRKLDRSTINEFIQKQDLKALGSLAGREANPRALGKLIEKLDAPTLRHVAAALDATSTAIIMDYIETGYLGSGRTQPEGVDRRDFEAIFRHDPESGAKRAGRTRPKLESLAAPDIVRVRQRTPLLRLPWDGAPPLVRNGAAVRLEPGRTYERDCATLQCTASWTGVRVRISDDIVERGFVPRTALELVDPLVIEPITYDGNSLAPDRRSLDRLKVLFDRLKRETGTHARITTRIDGTGSLPATSLAGARASVLADMFERHGVSPDRLRWSDHVTSPDPVFPGAIVELQRPADGS